MKKTSIVILSALAMLVLAACGGGSFKRTKSGLMYKIISDKKNPLAKKGNILKFNVVQKVRDSVLYNSESGMPAYAQVDSAVAPTYNPNEIFGLLRKGDSVVILFEADTILKKGMQLDKFIKPKDKIFVMFKITDVFTSEEEAQKDSQKEQELAMKKQEIQSEGQKVKEVEVLKQYLKSKNIEGAVSAPKGTLVIVKDPGTGAQVDSGKWVTVAYTGKSLEGKTFDSSIEPQFGHPPYTFQIGAQGAIAGWDDGLRLFKKGGKGQLFVPSVLAYGKYGSPPNIAPNQNLMFDVEVLEVSDTQPAPPAPVPGPGQNK